MANQDLTRTQKILKRFNAAGLIHTLISISVFVLSLIDYLNGDKAFFYVIQILSIVTIVNSFIWIVMGLVLIVVAGRLQSEHSTSKIRIRLFISLWFVLTPDILMIVLAYLPWLQGSAIVYFIGMASPLLVFIGWFIGKRTGKHVQ